MLDTPKRDEWSHRREFFLACLGYCVGLGNIWRFPYLCYANGGGAFIVAYVVIAVCVGMPMYFLEIAIGQFTKSGPINVFNLVPAMKGIGYGATIICTYFSIYNVVILAWGLLYLFHSFTTSRLVWDNCDSWFNSANCVRYVATTAHANNSIINNQTLHSNQSILSVDEFWNNYVLRKSSGIEDVGTVANWPLIACFVLSWIMSYLCSFKGARLTGKFESGLFYVVYFTAVFPYVVLTALVIRACTLSGADKGIAFYLFPNFTKLGQSSVWISAGSQVLYSYGIGFTVLVALGSYNDIKTNCYRYSALLTAMCSLSSFYAGFCVFGILGHLAHVTNKNVSEVVSSGPGLVFQTYPAAVSLMPLSQFWSVLFFFMILVVGIDSQFTCIEGIMCAVEDLYPQMRKQVYGREKMTLVVCLVMFVLGLPLTFGNGMYIFQIYDNYALGGFALFSLVLFESITFGYFYGVNQLFRDIEIMIGYKPSPFLKLSYLVIVPAMILGILIFSMVNYKAQVVSGYEYPAWAIGLGWMTITASLIPLPIVFLWRFFKAEGALMQKLRVITTARYPTHLQVEHGYGERKLQHEMNME